MFWLSRLLCCLVLLKLILLLFTLVITCCHILSVGTLFSLYFPLMQSSPDNNQRGLKSRVKLCARQLQCQPQEKFVVSAGWSYLSGVGLWLWRLEEWVWQLSHPHRHGRGDDGVFRVHHSVKKSLQIGLGVSPNMDDLMADRRVVLARIHDSE